MKVSSTFFVTVVAFSATTALFADGTSPNSLSLPKVPAGFSIELAAGPPLVERPIVASFDDEGRLYVAESSGSNDPVQKQLELKPHRIVRLEDSDGDGKFDKRVVFAEQMMFPEGALFFDGSLYVSAPPSIWKLTDKDGDGVSDERVEWFQGKTLTGCANDLHGPYAGPDGFIYWCKGAFAEQTHVVNGHEWKTKAAHIFRCRPDGSGFEPVMTGGMDNPVDVAFMPDGERILSGTFFHVNPRYDGLIHAIYGGVYGKDHGVLDGHPRTGELMPILNPINAAAGSGLERYDSDVFGAEYRDNLFLCQFNLRKVSRHVLRPAGASFTTEDSDFVSSDFVDFHPTDVQVDADGSLLVVDTGGWYKLCCPTSQLWKPEVLGGIYRVRKIGAKPPSDPRGRKIQWAGQSLQQLWTLLGDGRPAVRNRATREFVRRKKSSAVEAFIDTLAKSNAASAIGREGSGSEDYSSRGEIAAISRTWALSQIESRSAQQLIIELIADHNPTVARIALQSVSLHRNADEQCTRKVEALLSTSSPATRRIAAEALGRIRDQRAAPKLLAAAAEADDRVLQHSIIYALIELADPMATRQGLASRSPKTIAAALIALDQMPNGQVQPTDVLPHMGAVDEMLRQAARWVVSQHPDWGDELAEWFGQQLKMLPSTLTTENTIAADSPLQNMLVTFASNSAVQQLLADAVTKQDSPVAARLLAMRVMANSNLKAPPQAWMAAIGEVISRPGNVELPLAIAAARQYPLESAADEKIAQALTTIAESEPHPTELRVEAISILVSKQPQISVSQFALLLQSLSPETPVSIRSTAADAVAQASLSVEQLHKLGAAIESVGPLELSRLLKPFERSTDDTIGLELISSLKKSTSLASVRMDLLREALAKYGPKVQKGIIELESMVNIDAAAQRKHVEELLPLIATGDARRGHAVFYSSKAACSTCHRLGYAGGTTGPDLTHVGKTRSERDILESILFPSLSFVRSYEPMVVTTQDGKIINGVIRDDNSKEYILATGPNQEVRVARGDVDQIQPSTVSIMPAGLDKQLTTQELADLVAFLKSAAGK